MAKYELSSKKNIVTLGDKEFKKFFLLSRSTYAFANWAEAQGFQLDLPSYHPKIVNAEAQGFQLDLPSYHPKIVNKVLYDNFGSKIPLRFTAALYNTFIKDNIPREAQFAVKRLGFRFKNFDPDLVNVAVEHNHLVQQAVKDNTLNLLPLMLKHKESPQELKARYGKGLWKRLANTSKTRMNYLCLLLDKEPSWEGVRSCMLQEAHKFRHYPHQKGLLVAARIAPKSGTLLQTYNMVRDTVRMAPTEEYVNYDWSLKRWQEEHDSLVKGELLKRYSDNAFTESLEYQQDGYTFTLLNSKMKVAKEGNDMGHCVGSYAAYCSEGKYAVFHVEGNGERATLGLSKDLTPQSPKGFEFNQCYGVYNSKISPKLASALPAIIKRYNDDRV